MIRILYFIIFMTIVLPPVYAVPVFAQSKYQIKEMTPEVSGALESRRDRFEQLRGFKAKGIVGETNQGYVQVLENNSEAEALVQQENKDRKTIYETIAQQNGLEGALGTIEKVFGQVQRDKAEAGDKIQQEDGTWVTK